MDDVLDLMPMFIQQNRQQTDNKPATKRKQKTFLSKPLVSYKINYFTIKKNVDKPSVTAIQ